MKSPAALGIFAIVLIRLVFSDLTPYVNLGGRVEFILREGTMAFNAAARGVYALFIDADFDGAYNNFIYEIRLDGGETWKINMKYKYPAYVGIWPIPADFVYFSASGVTAN